MLLIQESETIIASHLEKYMVFLISAEAFQAQIVFLFYEFWNVVWKKRKKYIMISTCIHLYKSKITIRLIWKFLAFGKI